MPHFRQVLFSIINMFFFEPYLQTVTKYDLINTFFFKKLTQIPKLEKIILNFGYQKSNFKSFLLGLLALEFISLKRGKLTKSRYLNICLKIKKGNPVGYKVILKKNIMHFFFIKLGDSIFAKIKHSQTPKIKWNSRLLKSISFQLNNPLLFLELENQFQIFKNLKRLDITILTNCKSQKELYFFSKSIKLWIKHQNKSKNNSIR